MVVKKWVKKWVNKVTKSKKVKKVKCGNGSTRKKKVFKLFRKGSNNEKVLKV